MRTTIGWCGAVCALLVVAACTPKKDKPDQVMSAPAGVASAHADAPSTLTVSSSAFPAKGEIPKKYTCEGSDTQPPLAFGGVPAQAKSLVLIVEDPDAPSGTWVHWVVYNLPPSTTHLDEGGALPGGATAGVNDFKKTAYGGPCPPSGRHRYFFKLYALDEALPKLDKPTKASVEQAMQGHVIAKGELMGTYQKTG